MKNYLRAYIAYIQDNWVNHLSMAKFAISNHVNASIGMTPFFADHRFYPCTSIKSPGTFEGESEQKAKLFVVDKIVCRQEKMMSFLQDQLA